MVEILLDSVSFSLGQREVVKDVSVEVKSGDVLGIVGPSGCGKTTLLNLAGLILKPGCGEVRVDGDLASEWRGKRRRAFWRDRAAFVFQGYGVLDEESLARNVSLRLGKIRGAEMDEIDRLLVGLGLPVGDETKASHLSGGEKQRLALARAIHKKADVIFADEPTASLDRKNRMEVISILRTMSSNGRAVLVSTHDEDMINACTGTVELPGWQA